MKIPLMVFMSEIKNNLTPEKNQIFCFFYARIRKKTSISVRQPSPQKINFFPNHYASLLCCPTCLLDIILSVKKKLHLENSLKCLFDKLFA